MSETQHIEEANLPIRVKGIESKDEELLDPGKTINKTFFVLRKKVERKIIEKTS